MNNKEYNFSIIVPVYNTEKYIEKSLKSILKAMDTDCEVIIVNDGSTDNCEGIINDFISKLPEKYKDNFVYTKKDNKGLADTKNVGIEMARGKYISVVDSDDYISEDFYTIARKYIGEYDIIVYDLYIVFEKDSTWNYTSRACRDDKQNYLVALLNGAMSGSSCNKIIKKQLYNNHKFPVGKEYEDTAVTPFILTEAKNIKYIPYPLYYYLQREKSIVATNTFMTAFYKICNNITDVLRDKEIEEYEQVVNEFYVERIFDIFVQEYNENRNKFLENIEEFTKYNKRILDYIVKSNMVYKCENHYSGRQKKLTNDIIQLLLNGDYKKIKSLFFKRKFINYLRNIKGTFISFIKSIINR